MGFEPMTCALRVRCSTTELPGRGWDRVSGQIAWPSPVLSPLHRFFHAGSTQAALRALARSSEVPSQLLQARVQIDYPLPVEVVATWVVEGRGFGSHRPG